LRKTKILSMGNLKETHNVFLGFLFQKHFLCFHGKTLWKSQNVSLNGFFQGKHHPVPAVLKAFSGCSSCWILKPDFLA